MWGHLTPWGSGPCATSQWLQVLIIASLSASVSVCKTVEVKLDSAAACSPRCHESELRASHTVSHRIVCGVDPLVVPTAQMSKSRPSEDE